MHINKTFLLKNFQKNKKLPTVWSRMSVYQFQFFLESFPLACSLGPAPSVCAGVSHGLCTAVIWGFPVPFPGPNLPSVRMPCFFIVALFPHLCKAQHFSGFLRKITWKQIFFEASHPPCQKNAFILPSHLMYSLAAYLTLGWKSFQFWILKPSLFYLPTLSVASEKYSAILILDPVEEMFFFWNFSILY